MLITQFLYPDGTVIELCGWRVISGVGKYIRTRGLPLELGPQLFHSSSLSHTTLPCT